MKGKGRAEPEPDWTRKDMVHLIALVLIMMTLTAACLLVYYHGIIEPMCAAVGMDTIGITCYENGTPVSMTVTPR